MTLAELDHYWMETALELAAQAEASGEVPVGAVVVLSDSASNVSQPTGLLGNGRNRVIGSQDPSAHAEICAIREACAKVQNYRLPDCTLYTTLEPCSMCAGAIVHARLARVVFAAHDLRAGAAGSVFNLLQCPQLNHYCEVASGISADRSRQMLQAFFASRRTRR